MSQLEEATLERYRYALARIRKKRDGSSPICGVGVLVDDVHVLTCAHVVADALSRPHNSAKPSRDEEVQVDFPFAEESGYPSCVAGWWPLVDSPVGKKDDVAVLELTKGRPLNSETATLIKCPEDRLRSQNIQAYGYPEGCKEAGCYGYGQIQDKQSNGRYQVQNFLGRGGTTFESGGTTFQSGFSGAPVLAVEAGLNGVVGIIAQSRAAEKQAFIIPLDVVENLWPGLKKVVSECQTSLKSILPGSWQVQTSVPLFGQLGQIALELSDRGTLQAKLTTFLGAIMVPGTWQITSHNQLTLQGQMLVPLSAVVEFDTITPNKLSGSYMGQPVIFQRVPDG